MNCRRGMGAVLVVAMVVLLAGAALATSGCLGCSPKAGIEFATESDTEVEDQVDQKGDGPGDQADQKGVDVPEPDGDDLSTETDQVGPEVRFCLPMCPVGKSWCVGYLKIKFCVPTDDGCYSEWGDPLPCPEGTLCKQHGEGCVCEHGTCADGDVLDDVCVGEKLKCQKWTCEQLEVFEETVGCCAIFDDPLCGK